MNADRNVRAGLRQVQPRMAVLLRSRVLMPAVAEGFAFASSGLDRRLADAADAAAALELSHDNPHSPQNAALPAGMAAHYSACDCHSRATCVDSVQNL